MDSSLDRLKGCWGCFFRIGGLSIKLTQPRESIVKNIMYVIFWGKVAIVRAILPVLHTGFKEACSRPDDLE